MDIAARLAEEKIRRAIEEGAFDQLAGKGRPLRLDDADGVPGDLRMGYKILKNAGVLPPEMALRKEILGLQDLLDAAEDAETAARYRKALTLKQLQFELTMERRGGRVPLRYRDAVYGRMA